MTDRIQARSLQTREADAIELSISRESRTATLLFLEANNDALAVTIPLRQLTSMHRYLVELLQKEPALFAPE